MYGTVARMHVKPGAIDKMQTVMKEYDGLAIPGFVDTLVFRMDNDPNELYLVAVFDSKESYLNNAGDPAQNARYLKMAELLDGEPEWHDGEIVYQMK